MTRPIGFFVTVLVLVASAALAISAGPERIEVRREDSLSLPPTMGDWQGLNEAPNELLLPPDIHASKQLAMTYRHGPEVVWVSVGVYLDQGEGRRPAARELLFPGQGWTTLSEGSVRIRVAGEPGTSIPATLVVHTMAGQRAAILYWYQIGARSIASDHWYRAVGLYDRVIYGRADGALIRLGSPLALTVDPATAVAMQTRFMRVFYPWLLKSLAPRAHPGGGQS
jgi:EpsI family protein